MSQLKSISMEYPKLNTCKIVVYVMRSGPDSIFPFSQDLGG